MEKTTKFRWDESKAYEKKLRMCEKIRNFVSESRECQTLYANSEGSFPVRNLNSYNFSTVKDYIQDMMSDDLYTGPTEQPNCSAEADRILCKIRNISQRSGICDECRFFVVWIYFFDYDSKRIKAAPLFKVFTSRDAIHPSTCYFDTELNEYRTWDEVISKFELPDSFVCFPRGGSYRWVTSSPRGEQLVLDLEFVCNTAHSGNLTCRNRFPWSVRNIGPVIKKISPKLTIIGKGIRIVMTVLAKSEIAIHPSLIVVTLVSNAVIEILGKVMEEGSVTIPTLRNLLKDILFKLTNRVIPDSDVDLILRGNQSESASQSPDLEIEQLLTESMSFKDFLTLWKEPKKNFSEIIKYILRPCPGFFLRILRILRFLLNCPEFEKNKSLWPVLLEIIEVMCTNNCSQVNEARIEEGEREIVKFLVSLKTEKAPDGYLLENVIVRPEKMAVTAQVAMSPWQKASNLNLIVQLENFDRKLHIINVEGISDCRDFLREKYNSQVSLEKMGFFFNVVDKGERIGFSALITQTWALIVIDNNWARRQSPKKMLNY